MFFEDNQYGAILKLQQINATEKVQLPVTSVSLDEMMKEMGETQKVLIAKQMREEEVRLKRRKKHLNILKVNIAIGISAVVFASCVGSD